MLALTVWQPWASLIMIGARPFEFRDGSYLDRRRYGIAPQPGDRIVIHAGVRPVRASEVEDLIARLGSQHDTTGLGVERARVLLERSGWDGAALGRGTFEKTQARAKAI